MASRGVFHFRWPQLDGGCECVSKCPSSIRVLEVADKAFASTFWKQLERYEVCHVLYGHGTVLEVEGTHVRVRHSGSDHLFSARSLHKFLSELRDIPDDSIAAPAITFERELKALEEKWEKWQIDWRGLWVEAESIKALLQSCARPRLLTNAEIHRARSIGVGHIIPLAFEFAG